MADKKEPKVEKEEEKKNPNVISDPNLNIIKESE